MVDRYLELRGFKHNGFPFSLRSLPYGADTTVSALSSRPIMARGPEIGDQGYSMFCSLPFARALFPKSERSKDIQSESFDL